MKAAPRRAAPRPLPARREGLRRLIKAVARRAPTLLIAAAIVALLATGSVLVWQYLRPAIVAGSQYRLDPRHINITPPPPWIRADIRAEVFRDASLDRPLSILDAQLAEQVAAAFEFHPWVAKVRRVVKRFGPSMQVELLYRRPVLMVQVTGTGALRPADIHGVRLPDTDFSLADKQQYPRLVGVDSEPLVGNAWDDPRVAQAARLVTLLALHETPRASK